MKIVIYFLKSSFVVFLLLGFSFFMACNDDHEDDDMEMEDDSGLRIRKNAKDLTSEEMRNYTDAILALKAAPSPYSDTLSYYDQFVRFHQMAVEKTKCQGWGVAHANPAFPAWHRKLLMLYEDALSEVSGKKIALPYWEWSDPASTAATFSDQLMGGNGDSNDEYAVNSGPFRKNIWQVNLLTISANYQGLNPHPWLVRNFAATIPNSDKYPGYTVSLPTVGEITNCINISTYDMEPWDCSNENLPNNSFRFCLEGFLDGTCDGGQAMHNIGHDWVAGFFEIPVDTIKMIPVAVRTGPCEKILRDTVPNNIRVGSMEPLDVSPNDPTFFMHHCFVDKLWNDWQKIPGNGDNYVPGPSSDAPMGYKLDDNMYPYDIPEFLLVPAMTKHGITPKSMLSVDALGYQYQ